MQVNLPTLTFDLFDEMRRLLVGDDRTTSCVWHACDPYTTNAVCGIEGNGQSSNCGRTNKDGIDFVKAGRAGHERCLALYQTPQAYGGCQGCRFFFACKGHCPGTAIAGDWRNRSEHCAVWRPLFQRIEDRLVEDGVTPLSRSEKRSRIEQAQVTGWTRGNHSTIARILAQIDQSDKPAA